MKSTRSPPSGGTDGPSESPEDVAKPSEPSEKQDGEGDGDTAAEKSEEPEDVVPANPTRLSNRLSNSPSLDNIDLNDEETTSSDEATTTKPKGQYIAQNENVARVGGMETDKTFRGGTVCRDAYHSGEGTQEEAVS